VTAQDVIYRVLRHCAQIRPGYIASPELLNDCLLEWTALWDSWELDGNMSPAPVRAVYAFPANGGYLGTFRDFEIGPGAPDFNGALPVSIKKANLLLATTPTSRLPLAIRNWEQYGSIAVLTLPATGVTTELYYEPASPMGIPSAAFGIIHVWPPVSHGPSLEFWNDGSLSSPVTLNTIVSFAHGYENATVFSLAEKVQYLCPKEIRRPNPKLAAWALKSRQSIRNANQSNPKARSDFQTGRRGGGSTSGNLTLIGDL